MTRFMALSLSMFMLAAPVSWAQQTDDELVGDPERGKIVYRSVAYCINCHGWAADGKTGVNLRSPTGSNLRESQLDTEELLTVIRCGIPGTPMPFHDRAAYRDDRCYGMVMSDFDPSSEPMRGKTFHEKDFANVVAYLQAHVIGRGNPTFEECAEFYDNPDAKACSRLK